MPDMVNENLSPLATASRDLVVQLSKGAHPGDIETGCRELLTKNTNGLGSVDTRVVEVASEIVSGILSGAVMLRSETVSSATRGVSDTGPEGVIGDAERLDISERACLDVRDSHSASGSDYDAALKGAAPAARMTADQLRSRVDQMPPRKKKAETTQINTTDSDLKSEMLAGEDDGILLDPQQD
jgi:hypothetical protein